MGKSTNNSNSCIDISLIYPDIVDQTWSRVLFAPPFVLVMILGLFGNIITLYIVHFKGVNVGIHSYFLTSLAISGMLMAVTSLPITAVQTFTRVWVAGPIFCPVADVLQATGIFVGSFTLAAIAVERYKQIAQMLPSPGASPSNRSHLLVVVGLWLLAIGIASPHAVSMKLKEYPEICGHFCEEDWGGNEQARGRQSTGRLIYGVLVLSLQFLLPLILLAYSYAQLCRQVAQSVSRRLNHRLSGEARQRLVDRQHRTAKLTALLVAAFIIPWMPFNLYSIFRDMGYIPFEYEGISFAVVFLIAMTSTMWNPVIYCGFNKEFQRTLVGMFFKKKLGRSDSRGQANRQDQHHEKFTMLPTMGQSPESEHPSTEQHDESDL